jgi:Flp pilus assembly protein TadB
MLGENKVVVAGIVGAGLVWGWLLVLFIDQPSIKKRSQKGAAAENSSSKWIGWLEAFVEKWQTERRPYLNLLAVTIFTGWFAWLIYILTHATLLIPFFIALIIAFSVHFAWRQQLRQARKSS